MVDTTTKTKAAMLLELESIKGLLLEEDDIPILQEVELIESQTLDTNPLDVNELKEGEVKPLTFSTTAPEPIKPAPRVIVEEQQDFFASSTSHAEQNQDDADSDLLNTIEELEKHTADVSAHKYSHDAHKAPVRPSLTKATGENPFLPAHIRSRLHGNNPPPLFAQEAARKIASASIPTRLLGNTFGAAQPTTKGTRLRNAIVDDIVEKFMPEIERELREKLELLTKEQLEDLNR